MTNKPRLIIIIGQVLADPWLSISTAGQFPTWLPQAERLGIPVRHSHGKKPGKVLRFLDRTHEWARWSVIGQDLIPRLDAWIGRRYLDHVPVADATKFCENEGTAWAQNLFDVYALQRWKILGSLQQALREDFDFVYFTTASSYVRPSKLLNVVERLPRNQTYAGTRHVDARTGIVFGSGANRILSRDVAELVIRERYRYRNDVMEDVGLGELITGAGVELVELPSVNVNSRELLEALSDREIEHNFHFRMTSGKRQDRQDVSLMHALHERVTRIEKGGVNEHD